MGWFIAPDCSSKSYVVKEGRITGCLDHLDMIDALSARKSLPRDQAPAL